MNILFVADGRSPTARRWMQGVMALQHRVTLVSTYPCEPLPGLEALHLLPVAFGGAGGSQAGGKQGQKASSRLVGRARPLFQLLRYLLGPLSLPGYARRLEKIASETKPDLVHALRIPFEGMLAASARLSVPLVVTIWGNDLTLHGSMSGRMRALTVRTLRRTNGLLADAQRDLRLARLWGYLEDRPALVVPGGGGIDLLEMHRLRCEATDNLSTLLPAGAPLVVNPRGLRPGYIRTDVFFEAVPLVLQNHPDVYFICPSMAGQAEALGWIQRLRLSANVRLLPFLPQAQLWGLFQRAEITASISTHDGTPNTMLEAMACGCFPVAGDLESIREWITPGVNGLVVEPTKPQAVAEALSLALEKPGLRKQAAEINLDLVRQRAEVGLVRSQIEVFYQRLVRE